MLSDLLFNHPLAAALTVCLIAYGIAGAVILRGAR